MILHVRDILHNYTVRSVKIRPSIISMVVLLILTTVLLSGCVVYVHINYYQNNSKKFQIKKVMTNKAISNIPSHGMKRKIVNWFNYEQSVGEINSGELMTIPDDSYTIQEILDKFSSGIALNIKHQGEFSDSEDFEEVDMRSQITDFTDIPEIVEKRTFYKKSKIKTKEDSHPKDAPIEATPPA